MPYKDISEKFIIFADVPPDLNAEALRKYAECGFTAYLMTEDHIRYEDDPSLYLKILGDFGEYGLSVIMRGYNDGKAVPDYFGKFRDVDFRNYKNVIGFYMVDEPFVGDMDKLKEHCVPLYEPYKDLLWHINLLPSYTPEGALRITEEGDTPDRETFWKIDASPEKAGKGALYNTHAEISPFEHYVNEYTKKVLKYVNGPKDICFDHYPLFEKEGTYYVSDTWLSDFCVAAEAAKKHGARLGACVQAFSEPGWRILKTPAEIFFQLFTGLSFGVNIFEFFYYCPLSSIPRATPLWAEGKATYVYDFCKTAIEEIKRYEEATRGFKWQGIYFKQGKLKDRSMNFVHIENGSCSRFGVDWEGGINPAFVKIPRALKALEKITLESERDIIAGEFINAEGAYAYMIVNFTEPAAGYVNTVKITAKGDSIITSLIEKGETAEIFSPRTEVKLNGGDGAFLTVLNK